MATGSSEIDSRRSTRQLAGLWERDCRTSQMLSVRFKTPAPFEGQTFPLHRSSGADLGRYLAFRWFKAPGPVGFGRGFCRYPRRWGRPSVLPGQRRRVLRTCWASVCLYRPRAGWSAGDRRCPQRLGEGPREANCGAAGPGRCPVPVPSDGSSPVSGPDRV